jgi:2,3-bisphosphoglycerate-dependent phosphoglycerate mutase
MKKNKTTILLLLASIHFLMLISCTQTFYIVRHAEKADNSNDPELSAIGRERAVRLEALTADKKLDTVFTSLYKRTILTGLTVALPQSKPLISLNQTPGIELNKFTARLNRIGGNKNILVVGHTDTIPQIVFDLSGQPIAPIPENEYGFIFKVTKSGDSKTLETSRY